jgi:methylglutaconyl-CoA hydratase
MTEQTIVVESTESVCKISFNRAEVKNAFNAQLIQELRQVLTATALNSSIRLITLRGLGNNFCGGGDLNWMKNAAQLSLDDNLQDAQNLADLLRELYHFPKPTLAIVEGAAIGGGFGIAACCDIVLAEASAFFQLSEAKLGLAPAVISPYLRRAIGERHALTLSLTAERISAQKALEIGLVYSVAPKEQLEERQSELCDALLDAGPNAALAIKELFKRRTLNEITDAEVEASVKCIAQLRVSSEGQEGIKAFLEKRKPKWSI